MCMLRESDNFQTFSCLKHKMIPISKLSLFCIMKIALHCIYYITRCFIVNITSHLTRPFIDSQIRGGNRGILISDDLMQSELQTLLGTTAGWLPPHLWEELKQIMSSFLRILKIPFIDSEFGMLQVTLVYKSQNGGH